MIAAIFKLRIANCTQRGHGLQRGHPHPPDWTSSRIITAARIYKTAGLLAEKILYREPSERVARVASHWLMMVRSREYTFPRGNRIITARIYY